MYKKNKINKIKRERICKYGEGFTRRETTDLRPIKVSTNESRS